MEKLSPDTPIWSFIGLILVICVLLPWDTSWSQDPSNQPATRERLEGISLADAAIRALENNLDISISRQTKESRLTDIIIEQAKFHLQQAA